VKWQQATRRNQARQRRPASDYQPGATS
jgi:hypothetical protein